MNRVIDPERHEKTLMRHATSCYKLMVGFVCGVDPKRPQTQAVDKALCKLVVVPNLCELSLRGMVWVLWSSNTSLTGDCFAV